MSALHKQLSGFAGFVNGDTGDDFASVVRANGLGELRRLTIYRRGVEIGFSDALAGVYEVIKKLVGDDFFNQLAVQYARKHPSQTGNVHDFGELFAEFLESMSNLESLPYLPDVAHLEWHYHSIFHSPTGDMLDIEKLSLVPESSYGKINLLLSPTCRLLSSNFPVLRIWQSNQDGNETDEVISLDEGGDKLAIVRDGKQILFYSFEPGAFALLAALARGETFLQAYESALHIDPDCDVGQVLQDVVSKRMISGFTVNG